MERPLVAVTAKAIFLLPDDAKYRPARNKKTTAERKMRRWTGSRLPRP